jgi:protein-S-isoprenylcysteine O-methyltransferase Ste14
VAGYLPYALYARAQRADFGFLQYAGWLVIAAGVLIYLRCAWDFATAGRGTPLPADPPRELVVRGLYRYVRNPMYLGVGSVLFGEALAFQIPAMFIYIAVVFLFWHLFVVVYEERALERKFGRSYRSYRQSVPRWFPRLAARTTASSSR